MLEPSSIAIIGASATEGKVGHDILKNLLDQGFEGKIYPINPKHDEILETKAYESVKDVSKVLSRFVDCITIRTYPHETVVELADDVLQSGTNLLLGVHELAGLLVHLALELADQSIEVVQLGLGVPELEQQFDGPVRLVGLERHVLDHVIGHEQARVQPVCGLLKAGPLELRVDPLDDLAQVRFEVACTVYR